MSCFRVIVSSVLSVLKHRPQDSSATFRRVGVASLLFAVARPRDARAAALGRTAIRLTMSLGPREVPMRDIHAVSLERQWAWGDVRIRTARGDTVVSGLRRRDAATLAAAAEEARIAWWREFLVEHADALRAIDARLADLEPWREFLVEHADALRAIDTRLADLEAPQCYVRPRAFSSLVEEAQRAASVLPQWWPERLDGEPVVQSAKRVRSFLSDPEAARTRANQIFKIRQIDARLSELNAPESYVRHRAFTALVKKAKRAPSSLREWYPEQVDPEPTVQALNRIRSFLSDPKTVRKRANKTFLKAELKRSRGFLDRVEALPLKEEQRRAVCVDDDRNLVVAGAGSGKTSVMVAKAGWIVERGDRRPKDLLLLAFAHNARDELKQRVEQRLDARAAEDMSVQTFHSLGLSIIRETERRSPSVAKAASDDAVLLNLLTDIIKNLLDHPQHGRELIRWLAYDATPYRSEHEFRSMGEYWDYIRNHDIRSLQGELVKSLEECIIANFLYLNGVCYEYERRYEHDTATAKKAQYKPDFYLTDAGIYIEHFALSENGDTPPFIDRAKYTASRKWKLKLHAKHGTTLIETFSHEQAAGQLTERLADKLRAHGVALNPIPTEEIFAVLKEQRRVAPFTQLVATFLQHFKGARLSIETVEGQASDKRDRGRSEAFLRVFRPIFELYEAKLAEAGEIDFHDMINRATDYVSAGRYRKSFGYILVDEFQDISPGRAALLKALLDQSPEAQLFAVGDDWQAIFRFTGSDISFMREFEQHFGTGPRTVLKTTFRCSDGLCDVASHFVLRNPAQIVKSVRPVRHVDGPGVWIGCGCDGTGSVLSETLDRIATDAAPTEGRPSVLLLGRYRHLKPEPDNMRALQRNHPGLDLSYQTVHAAKGLEADYVVVLGICTGRFGFPSEITDDPLLDLVLAAPEEHPNAEERRLFYVALTRAKRRAYLLEKRGPRSAFIEELLVAGGRIDIFGSCSPDAPPCPECRKGRLVPRRNEGGRGFYGCTNYPYCGHTNRACPNCEKGLPVRHGEAFRCPECGHQVVGCPRCDGWLGRKEGKHGPFLGCSNWPACEFASAIRRH